MGYICEICSYSTEYISNMNKHKKSKRHAKNIDVKTAHKKVTPKLVQKCVKNFSCPGCEKSFTRKYSLDRHSDRCKNDSNKKGVKKGDSDYVHSLESKVDMLIKDKEYLEKMVNMLENDIQRINLSKQFAESMGLKAADVAKMSAFALINKYFDSTQPLTYFNDFDALEDEAEYWCLENNSGDMIEHDLAEKLVWHYKNDTLTKYLSDFIRKIYVTEKPENQKIWNTDTSRLKLVVRCIIEKKNIWVKDTNGDLVVKYVIDPITNYILEILPDYREHLTNKFKEENNIDKSLIIDEYIRECDNLKDEIQNRMLHSRLLRHIQSHFEFDKNKHLLIK